LSEGLGKFKTILEGLEDPYFRERGGDVEDVGNRVLKNLVGLEKDPLKELDREVILVSVDLSPSDTVSLSPEHVKGFATDIGGRTSHVAIVARSLGLPAAVGMGTLTTEVLDGDILIVDGNEGRVIVNPDTKTLKEYRKEKENYAAFYRSLEAIRNLPARTPDGREVVLAGNIEMPHEVDDVLAHGAQGIGLFRTEFLFLNRDTLPTEDEQFEVYREVARMRAERGRKIATHSWGAGAALMQNLHMAFAAPNTCILENPPDYAGLHSEVVDGSFVMKDGHALPPDRPGLGIVLTDETGEELARSASIRFEAVDDATFTLFGVATNIAYVRAPEVS